MRDGMDDERVMRTLTAHAKRIGHRMRWYRVNRQWRGWKWLL